MANAFTSKDATVPAVDGDNTADGTGVHGRSAGGFGVYGEATGAGRGVVASSVGGYGLRANSTNSSGIRASSANGVGIEAAGGTAGLGVPGTTDGVVGSSPTGNGVRGETTGSAAGVVGTSAAGAGVLGNGTTAGVEGNCAAGAGVIGNGKTAGVEGNCAEGAGVVGNGKTGGHFDGVFEGIHAVGHDQHAAGIAGYNTSTGIGVFGKSANGPAGYFAGSVVVTGDIQLTGGDLAEQFEVADATGVEPGTVMVLDGADRVRVSESAYDRRVVGVLAGAGSHRPGVVLDHHAEASNRQALALVGKAYCKVDASASPVEVGDLLTTSSTRGHAMKASESDRAFGAVLGKAMESLSHGRGLLPIVVALQ
jgi:hypothetical protein